MDTKKSTEEETRRLTFLVVFMSILVLVLFGLAPPG